MVEKKLARASREVFKQKAKVLVAKRHESTRQKCLARERSSERSLKDCGSTENGKKSKIIGKNVGFFRHINILLKISCTQRAAAFSCL